MEHKYWIVRPECYKMINDVIKCFFYDGQIQQMIHTCKEGVIVYRKSSFYYRDLNHIANEIDNDCEFQFEINLKLIRKLKMEKLNGNNQD